MTRWILIAVLAVAMAIGAVWLYLAVQLNLTFTFAERDPNDPAALDALERRPFHPLVEGTDFVVIQDGADGWFELDVAALPQDVEIGFFGPRIFDVFTGNDHVPLYCGGTGPVGRIIWGIRDGQIEESYAFCNPRRMDLRPLRQAAMAVEMVTEQLPRAELLGRIASVAADPAQAQISQPYVISPFSHRMTLSLPFQWRTEGALSAWEDEVIALLNAVAPGEVEAERSYTVNRQTTLTVGMNDPDIPEQTGFGLNRDGVLHIGEGLLVSHLSFTIRCQPAACTAITDPAVFDALTQLQVPYRDLDRLRAALATAVRAPGTFGAEYIEQFPTEAELLNADITATEAAPILYHYRFIVRP